MKDKEINQITVIRKKELNNRLRSIIVLLDDKEKIKLTKHLKNIMIEKNHSVKLKAKIDWCYSSETLLNFNDSHQKKVIVSSQISNLYMILIFTSALLGIILTLIKGNWMYMIPFFILYLKPLYFITIGRKRYLKIDVIE